MKYIATFAALLLLFALLGCGSNTAPAPTTHATVPHSAGPGMPVAPYDGFELTDASGKETLGAPPATYYKFFADTVNAQSTGRWTTQNIMGKKAWTLSNTCHSAPKSWLFGGNAWPGESDILQSMGGP